MPKKTKNPFDVFGETLASIADGSIFDIFDEKDESNEVEAPKVNANDNGNERSSTIPDTRGNGSTFTNSASETRKGSAINRKSSGASGNDGSGVSSSKGNASEDEKPE